LNFQGGMTMELIERNGGFGIFQLNSKEVTLLGKMRALAENEYKYVLGSKQYPETQEFSTMMKDLFPEVPQPISNVYCPKGGSDYFFPFASYQQLGIDSNFPRGTIRSEHNGDRSRLTIIFSKLAEQNQYPISMALMEFYTPSYVDDVVKMLGEREIPVLHGLTPLPPHIDRGYGIAEVHRLGATLNLYKRANELVNDSEGMIGVSKKELRIMRRDGMEHENVVIRDLSRERYQKELQRLIDY